MDVIRRAVVARRMTEGRLYFSYEALADGRLPRLRLPNIRRIVLATAKRQSQMPGFLPCAFMMVGGARYARTRRMSCMCIPSEKSSLPCYGIIFFAFVDATLNLHFDIINP